MNGNKRLKEETRKENEDITTVLDIALVLGRALVLDLVISLVLVTDLVLDAFFFLFWCIALVTAFFLFCIFG